MSTFRLSHTQLPSRTMSSSVTCDGAPGAPCWMGWGSQRPCTSPTLRGLLNLGGESHGSVSRQENAPYDRNRAFRELGPRKEVPP